jgi:hypothetical protein
MVVLLVTAATTVGEYGSAPFHFANAARSKKSIELLYHGILIGELICRCYLKRPTGTPLSGRKET